MNFHLTFTAPQLGGPLFPVRSLGLHYLKMARQVSDVPQLNMLLVADHVYELYSTSITLSLTEGETRSVQSVERFREHNQYEVRTTVERMRKYYTIAPVVSRSDTTGEVIGVTWVYQCDEHRMLEDWRSAGCPEKW